MSRLGKSKGPSQRQLRIGEQVRHALANLLQRGDIADSTLEKSMISVTEVRMTNDLKIATAYVTVIGNGDTQAAIKALAKNAKFIRGRISFDLRQMKFMPTLRFLEDDTFDNFQKINDLLRSPGVARDLHHDDDE